jgi:hypothetical protein
MQTRKELIQEIIDKLLRHESYLSYSSLSNFKESPRSFIDYKLKEKKETDAMIFGSMVHCLILEPNEFENRYFILEDTEICSQIGGAKPRATNAYKEWKSEQESKAGERTIISKEDFEAANYMALNVKYNRAASRVLNQATEHEKNIEWELKNFKFRGIIDGEGEDIIFDLKSCADASPRKFQRTIIDMDYHLQAALYLKGVGVKKRYFIIAMDKNNGVSVHELSDSLIEHAMNEIESLLDKFNECILNDEFNTSFDFWAERFDGIFIADKPDYLYQ